MEILPTLSNSSWVVPEKEMDINTVLNMFEFNDESPPDLQHPSPLSTPQLSPYTSDDGSANEFDPSIFDDPSLLPDIERILAQDPIANAPLSWNLQQQHAMDNTKKRPRDEGVREDVLIPRDQLLTMTSKEIEDYVTKLKSQRTLTISEEKELKRQRRLIKNREYASQSRHRKKAFVDDLQKKLEMVQDENSLLKCQVQALSEENHLLKGKIGAIVESIKKKSTTSSCMKKLTSIGRPSTPNKTISACLLVMMFMAFTVGVFWENQPNLLPVFPNGKSIHLTTRVLLSMNERNHLPIFPSTEASKPEVNLLKSTMQPLFNQSTLYSKDL